MDREKLTHNNNQNAKLQRQMENKKFISKLFQSSLLPPVALPPLHPHSQTHKLSPKGFSLNDSQLYLNSPNKHFTVDIDQCQLVQSFMKHSETGKQYMESKKGKAKVKDKTVKKAVKQSKVASGQSKHESKNRNRSKHSKHKVTSSDTLPFFATSA